MQLSAEICLADEGFVSLLAEEERAGVYRLSCQHIKPAAARDPALGGVGYKLGAQGIIYRVRHAAQTGEKRNIYRLRPDIRIHPDGSGVDDYIRIRMVSHTFLVSDGVRSIPAGNKSDLGGIQMLQYGDNGFGSTSVTKDKAFTAFDPDVVFFDHIKKTGKVCIMSLQTTVLVHDRIYGTDGGRIVIQAVQIRDHILLIRDRHIDRFKIVLFHKIIEILPAYGTEIVGVICKLFMNFL